MRRLALGLVVAIATVTVCLVLILAGEGLHAVFRWNRSDQSILYKGYGLIRRSIESRNLDDSAIPDFARLAGRAEFARIIPALKAARAGLGDTDYDDLGTDEVNIADENGCLLQKPDQRKVMAYIRTTSFQLFDPPLLFSNVDALSDEVREFIRRYGQPPAQLTTNRDGERVTVPPVNAPEKVLIAGDSVADGVGVDDAQTLSSKLQGLDQSRQYVNLGVAAARASDIVCALEKAEKRYSGTVAELIYVYCENDFDAKRPFGTPEQVVDWLASFAARQKLRTLTIVYAPYVYNVVPQLTRFRGYRGEWFPAHFAEARRLREKAQNAGFRFVDIADLAVAEISEKGSQFAAFSIYVDHVHLSPYGTARLAEQLRHPSEAGE